MAAHQISGSASEPSVNGIAAAPEGNQVGYSAAGTGLASQSPIGTITFPIAGEQKVTVTYDYVSYGGASSPTLQRPGAPGGWTSIRRLRGGTVAVGGSFTPRPQPPTIVVGSVTYKFAFQYVSNGASTAQPNFAEVASFVAGVPPESILVGNAPIAVLVLYVPIAAEDLGNGPGSVGIGLDDPTSQLRSEALVPVGPEPWGFW